MIKEESIQRVREAAAVVDVISDYLKLTKKGASYIARCPFHDEKSASFYVSPVKNTYKCFGCGEFGDSFSFLMKHEQMTYVEAIKFLAARFKVKLIIDNESAADQEANVLRDSIFGVNKWAQSFFSTNYNASKTAQDYVKSRQLEDAVAEFGIGYAEPGNALMIAAQAQGYSVDTLLAAGLIKKNETGSYYDAFSRRLMFPFFDRSGQILGFTGRILTADKNTAKYLNTSDTEVFHKSKFLYGLYHAKKEIAKQNECILVEGQTDTISLHLAKIKNVIAGSGTALSEFQVKLIRNLTSTLTLIYDYDPAGIKAAVSNIKIPLQLGMDVYVVVLPNGEDPDSMVKKVGSEEMAKYIESNRTDIVTFRINLIKEEISKDLNQKARLVKDLTSQISLIADEQTRGLLIHEVVKQLGVNAEELQSQVKRHLPEPVQEEKGFYGLNVSSDFIKEKDQVIILPDPSQVVEMHSHGWEQCISLPWGPLAKDDLFKIQNLTKNVTLIVTSGVMDENDQESPWTTAGRLLTSHGLRTEVAVFEKDDKGEYSTKERKDFFDFYVEVLSTRNCNHPDIKRAKKYTEMVAEFLSTLDNTIIHIKTNDVAKKFGLTQAAFSKVLKPFVDKRKNLALQQQEQVTIDEQQFVFDIRNLPDYVDVKFFHQYGFFAAQNKAGHKLFYVFKSADNNTLIKVGNFYLEPLFHVHDLDQNRNKRVCKLFHADMGREEYVEFRSADMTELGPFKKFLWGLGGYIFTNGKQYHHEKILESIALRFPKCFEFSVFGWQPEGFFAFSNGIISDGSFTSVDELGLVKYKNDTYYSPAFSKIYKDLRVDNDKYEYDRYLVYKPDQRTNWQEWSTLMRDVYSYNSNGTWALLFTMLSAHRSVIFQIDRLFTSLFFIGPTESGKSKIAESIRAPFMHGAPLFNLNSGTDAAFFTTLERFRDIPVILEEYNDYQISDVKFQGLKAAVYDNEGKQKRKDASSKDIDVSKVNGSPVLLGQESPERDDGSLGNRVVLLHVQKKDDWTDDEVNRYIDLKSREKDGLSNIAYEIIRRRPVIQQFFPQYMRQLQKKLKEDIQNEGGTYQTRIINTVTLFISMAKLWEDHVNELPLPFSFDEFYTIAKAQVIRQSEELSSTNRLAIFFDTISMLYSQGQIISGREFDIVVESTVSIQESRNQVKMKVLDDGPKKILYLIVNDVIHIYQKLHSGESLKLSALRTYLKDHPSFIGPVKSHRFSYEYEAWENDPMNSYTPTRRVLKKAERNTSCIALDYSLLESQGMDLERVKMDSNSVGALEQVPQNSPDLFQNSKEDLPF